MKNMIWMTVVTMLMTSNMQNTLKMQRYGISQGVSISSVLGIIILIGAVFWGIGLLASIGKKDAKDEENY